MSPNCIGSWQSSLVASAGPIQIAEARWSHHLLAEIVLAQHELDEMRAHGEDAEPEPAAAGPSEARGIARHDCRTTTLRPRWPGR